VTAPKCLERWQAQEVIARREVWERPDMGLACQRGRDRIDRADLPGNRIDHVKFMPEVDKPDDFFHGEDCPVPQLDALDVALRYHEALEEGIPVMRHVALDNKVVHCQDSVCKTVARSIRPHRPVDILGKSKRHCASTTKRGRKAPNLGAVISRQNAPPHLLPTLVAPPKASTS
jgi:hypothetical protein